MYLILTSVFPNLFKYCDKSPTFERLSNKSSTDEKINYEIKIDVSSKENTISISDDGIGMDKDDLVNSLGTIAKSGTTEFLAKLEAAKDEDKSKSLNLICLLYTSPSPRD